MRAYYSNKRPRGGRSKRRDDAKLQLGKPRTMNDDKQWAELRGQSGDRVERGEDMEEERAYLLLIIKGLADRVVKGVREGVTRQF